MSLSKNQLINLFKVFARSTGIRHSSFEASVVLFSKRKHLLRVIIKAEEEFEEVITGYIIELEDETEVVFKLNEQPEYTLTQSEYENLFELA
jgi:hypothetical protein